MAWQDYLDAEQARFVQELLAFVRIPSVSAKPENIPDVVKAAEWVGLMCGCCGGWGREKTGGTVKPVPAMALSSGQRSE